MMNCAQKFYSDGFTLMEMVLVIAIIGILSVIALPNFMNYQCKAKQVEARQALGSLAKCQEAYHTEFTTYSADLESIGFATKGKSKYEYEVTLLNPHAYVAKAKSKTPGVNLKGEGDDIWTINQSLYLSNRTNACN